jgi:hypothetical protein
MYNIGVTGSVSFTGKVMISRLETKTHTKQNYVLYASILMFTAPDEG